MYPIIYRIILYEIYSVNFMSISIEEYNMTYNKIYSTKVTKRFIHVYLFKLFIKYNSKSQTSFSGSVRNEAQLCVCTL